MHAKPCTLVQIIIQKSNLPGCSNFNVQNENIYGHYSSKIELLLQWYHEKTCNVRLHKIFYMS